MPADDFTSCKTKDDPNYDYFACQFFESLTRYQTSDANGYWFGRLITFEFTLDNLVGANFNENNFRQSLENNDIIFHSYTLQQVNYTPAEDLISVAVAGTVEFDITINQQRSTTTADFSFQIKPGWLATEGTFS